MKDAFVSSLQQLLGSITTPEEMQAMFFITLCCLGAWVVLCWIIQLIRYVLWIWPLVLIIGVLIAVPSFRMTLTHDFFPKQMDDIVHMMDQKYYEYNETLKW